MARKGPRAGARTSNRPKVRSEVRGAGPARRGGGEDAPQSHVGRRDFLKIGGLTAAAAAGPGALGCAPDMEDGKLPLALTPDFELLLLRKEDLVSLRIGFVNLKVDGSGAVAERIDSAKPAYLIVTHHPQHVLEEAFSESGPGLPPPPGEMLKTPPIPARIAGESRVVFIMPTGQANLQLTNEAILEATRTWEMSVAVNATPPPAPPLVFHPFPGLLASDGLTLIKPGLSPVLPKVSLGGATDVITRAVVQCAEDGRPPPVTAANLILAARNARAYATAARIGGVDLLPDAIVAPVLRERPGRPRAPGTGETAIELPFRLQISPNKLGGWAHATAPVASPSTGRVELWHTRLGMRRVDKDGNALPTDEGPSYYKTIRALWTRDPGFNAVDPTITPPAVAEPFQASLNRENRHDIVHQSANHDLGNFYPGEKPKTVDVNRLMLTTLGGYLDARGDFGDEPALGLALWEHRATLGRDHFVKIVETGILYPFGNRAVVITISERKLKRDPADAHPHIAFVRQRRFIVVKEPVKEYKVGRDAGPTAGPLRKLPFTTLTFKTLITPNLDIPEGGLVPPVMWPEVQGERFRFKIEAVDVGGRIVKTTTPVLFLKTQKVPMAPKGSPMEPPGGVATYNSALAMFNAGAPDTWCELGGQRITVAPPSSKSPDDTTFEAQRLRFEGTNFVSFPSGYRQKFLPVMAEAELAVEALRQLAGAKKASSFKFHDKYVSHGFASGGGQNPGELLMELVNMGQKIGADFSSQSDRSGGFVAPSIAVTGLSRKIGPVAGTAMALGSKVANNLFDPKTFFADLPAKLFGVFPLSDLIPEQALENAPQFVTEAMDVAETFLQDVQKLMSLFNQAKDAITGAASEISTLAMSIQTAINAFKAKLEELSTDIQAIVDAIAGGDLSSLATNLTELGNDLVDLVNTLPTIPQLPLTGAVKEEIKKGALAIKSVIDTNVVPAIQALDNAIEMAKNLRVRLEFKPVLQDLPSGFPIFHPKKPEKCLSLSLELRGKDLPGKPAGFDFICSLDEFDLNLIGTALFMILEFTKVQLRVESGKKPEVDVQFKQLTFAGPLEFVNKLKDLIPLDGFSDPPGIDVSLEGIKASFSLPIPTVAVGIFSIQNITLGAGFNVPFIGDALTVNFNFCTKENPFILTVSFLGGGGFFGITLYPKGVYLLEAALEFGACLAVDFGVASGSCSIMAGIYFKMELDEVTLKGYLEIKGKVSVLGLISASIRLYMELSYESASGKVIGRAELEIKVEIFFLSFSVTVSAEKKFAGSNEDPTFEQIMGPEPANDTDPWAEYVAAFAA
jgi:hypothetical protein